MTLKNTYIYNAFVHNVIDGDTFDVTIDLGFSVTSFQRIRLYGIDAYETSLRRGTTPEEKEKGLAAKHLLQERLEGKNVVLETIQDKQGKYGRYLANVYIDGESVADILTKHAFVKQ